MGAPRVRRGAPTAHDTAGMEHALRLARAAAVRDEVGDEVLAGRLQATTAADRIISAFDHDGPGRTPTP